jgi:uncharacterized protein (TIGR00299 family) protein
MISNPDQGSSDASHSPHKILYVEPFSGISGDMLVGALLDLGLDPARLQEKLGLLPLSGYNISVTRCERSGIHAAKFHVLSSQHEHDAHGHGHRSFREIRALIDSSGLSDWAKQKAIEAFRRLAEAEGKIHNLPPEEVHFHEVGAMDSIIDIVGAAVSIEELLPVRVVSAPINVGQGMLTCRHGIYPAPGPATVELLKEVPIYSNEISGELTTPTGATLLITFAESFGPRPLMRVGRIGYGAGDREIRDAANVLRVTLGEEADQDTAGAAAEQVAVIEATLDDMNPQVYGYFQEKALSAGALDVFVIPAQMKKNRPGMLLTVVCAPDQLDAMAALIFAETTTIGVRHTLAFRKTLAREFLEVQTEFGAVTVKIASSGGRRMNFAPEFECCRRLAQQRGVSLKEVMAAASRAFLESER